jgi:hypothetical protein
VYVAVIEYAGPEAGTSAVHETVPLDKVPVQRAPNVLSENVTVPVAAEPDPEYVTDAVKVSVPAWTGLEGPVTVVVVVAWFTTCDRAADWADAAKFVLPP